MPVKMTGAQYKAFLAADWGPDAMWEEEAVTVDGDDFDTCDGDVGAIPDASLVVLTGGVIIPDQMARQTQEIDAERFARKWLKAQTTVTLMVDVPREHADWFASSIKGMGVNKEFAKIVGRIG